MIHPTKGRILVRKMKVEDSKTDEGIYIPGSDMVEEDLYFGEVVEHNGDDKLDDDTKIHYSRYSAQKLYDKERKEFLYIVSDLDIQAIEK